MGLDCIVKYLDQESGPYEMVQLEYFFRICAENNLMLYASN